jgi:hypothetical protein
MVIKTIRWLIIGVAAIAVATSALGDVFRGVTPAGARYIVQTPPNWRVGNGLVIVNHGFQFEAETGDPSLGPEALSERMLAQGFALAASSYSTTGWATFTARTDLTELLAAVQTRLAPGQIAASLAPLYLSGGSLGGLISVQQAELLASGELSNTPIQASGVLSLCPPLAGSVVWDQAMDFRLAYDAICESTGGEFPNGPSATPWLLRPGLVDSGGSNRTYASVAAAAATCVGFELPNLLVSNNMRTRKARMLAATQVSEPFLPQLLFYATFAASDVVYDVKKLGALPGLSALSPALAQPFDSRGLEFADAELNARLRRLTPDPLARFELLRQFTPSGRIGSAKLLTVSTSGDGLVVPEHLRFLEGKLATSQWRRALVNETRPSHCGFSDSELLASWEQLVQWTRAPASAPLAPPEVVTRLNQACALETTANLAATQCRFSSAESLSPLASKIVPRAARQVLLDGGVNGDWYTPSRPGEGFKVEALTDGRAQVTFFTYPKVGVSAQQLWLTGTGRILDNGLAIDDLYRTRGGRFGDAFDPAAVRLERWGSASMVLTACGSALLSFKGPDGYGEERRTIAQLTRQQVPCDSRIAQRADTGLSGSWFDPARGGEGVQLTVQTDLSGQSSAALFLSLGFFTYTPSGEQAWFVVQTPMNVLGTKRTATGTLLRPVGTRFGAAFQASQVTYENFGSAEIEFSDCRTLKMQLRTPWGARSYSFSRLTEPQGVDCELF